MRGNHMDQAICRQHCYRKLLNDQPRVEKKHDEIKLTVFDMDGVLTDIISSWQWIHEHSSLARSLHKSAAK